VAEEMRGVSLQSAPDILWYLQLLLLVAIRSQSEDEIDALSER